VVLTRQLISQVTRASSSAAAAEAEVEVVASTTNQAKHRAPTFPNLADDIELDKTREVITHKRVCIQLEYNSNDPLPLIKDSQEALRSL
jgi:hypothetical protein